METQSEQVIILVDNNVSNLELIEQAVKHVDQKAKCICLLHGDEAIDVLELELNNAPSYIFVDANMSDMPIMKCLLILNANHSLRKSCIIVFSSVMPMAVADVYRQQGADFAFTKPLTIGQAENLIEHIVHTNPKRRVLQLPDKSVDQHS